MNTKEARDRNREKEDKEFGIVKRYKNGDLLVHDVGFAFVNPMTVFFEEDEMEFTNSELDYV